VRETILSLAMAGMLQTRSNNGVIGYEVWQLIEPQIAALAA
jgi:hypothetical protein